MEVLNYAMQFDATPVGMVGETYFKSIISGEMPAEAVVVAIFDPRNDAAAAAWVRIDTLGDDDALRANVLGRALLGSINKDSEAT